MEAHRGSLPSVLVCEEQKAAAPQQNHRKQKGPKGFAFVESTPSGRTPAEHRRIVRSHVMRGKNTAKRLLRFPAHVEPVISSGSAPPSTISCTCSSSSSADTPVPIEKANDRESGRRFIFWPPTPSMGKLPPELVLCVVAEEVDQTSRYFIHQVFATIKDSMYPLEWSVKQDDSSVWFHWMCTDTAYFHSLLFTASAFHDLATTGSDHFDTSSAAEGSLTSYFSPRTRRHLQRTMELLQQRLYDNRRQLEDITAAVVITLAMMANAIGDTETCKVHVSGLRRLIHLRGGMNRMRSSLTKEVQLKICRLDLAWSIQNGCKPVFFDDDVSWSRRFDKNPIGQSLPGYLQNIDIKLYNVYADMCYFTHAASAFINSKDNKFQPTAFQEIIMSIQYRLLLLDHYSPELQPIEEAIRAGLLAFHTSVFLLVPGLKITGNHDFLSSRLRLAISMLNVSTPALRDLKLWLLLIGSITMFDIKDAWLIDAVTEHLVDDLQEWPHVRERMKSIMWIDFIHDMPGKQMFNAVR